jgi:hypothetical protein
MEELVTVETTGLLELEDAVPGGVLQDDAYSVVVWEYGTLTVTATWASVVKGVAVCVTTRVAVAQVVVFDTVEHDAMKVVKTDPGGAVTNRLTVVDTDWVVPTAMEVSVGDDVHWAMTVGKGRGAYYRQVTHPQLQLNTHGVPNDQSASRAHLSIRRQGNRSCSSSMPF